jgi:Flp pilus assembly pilin Flp
MFESCKKLVRFFAKHQTTTVEYAAIVLLVILAVLTIIIALGRTSATAL